MLWSLYVGWDLREGQKQRTHRTNIVENNDVETSQRELEEFCNINIIRFKITEKIPLKISQQPSKSNPLPYLHIIFALRLQSPDSARQRSILFVIVVQSARFLNKPRHRYIEF